METFSITANASNTIGYSEYGKASWHVGSSNGACQGAYQKTSASGSRVGIMVFKGAGVVLEGKKILDIELSITCSKAGSGSSSKVLTVRKANIQAVDTTVKGRDQVGEILGTIVGKFYGNTTVHRYSPTNDPDMFNALASYFSSGMRTLCIYNGETSSKSGYSKNYARITSITLTVHYENPPTEKNVYYYTNNAWKKCVAYLFKNGSWVKVDPNYFINGTWK